MKNAPISAADSASEAATAKSALSVEAWAEAALDALAAGGLDAVAVEPLARKLRVTKGSFYWHFQNREALLRAALALWEKRETVDLLEAIGDVSDPYERIFRVFRTSDASFKAGRLYLALAAASDDPVVAEVVERVSAQRLNNLRRCYREIGLSELDARLWSTFAYATFIGNQQVHRDLPQAFPDGADFREYFKLMVRQLIPRDLPATPAG